MADHIIACPGSFMDARKGITFDTLRLQPPFFGGSPGYLPARLIFDLRNSHGQVRFLSLAATPEAIRELALRLTQAADDLEAEGPRAISRSVPTLRHSATPTG